jgi:hypothetical protein
VPEVFQVTKSKRKECGLFSGNTNTVTTYKVLKIENEFGEEYTNYYGVPGDTDFTRTQDPEAEEFHIQKRYEDQIAFAVCQPGWIEKVWVNSGEEDEDTDVRINARKCGVASVLTELCLRDPKVNKLSESSKAFENLMEEEREDIEDKINIIKHDCKHFVGMEMSAKPIVAAIGYLNAAIRSEYFQMAVQERFHETKEVLSFNFYNTKIAKENFNPETGTIGPCEGKEECNGVDAYRYFCEK